MNPSTALLSALLAGLALAPAAHAQSAQIGKALHTFNCESAGCHRGTPPNIDNNAQRAANSPATIRNAIRGNVGGMGYLDPLLSDSDLADIAKYIAGSSPLPPLGDADRLLNWAEWKFQAMLQPRASSQSVAAFTVRQYTRPQPNIYLGIANGRVYTYIPSTPDAKINDIGPLADFLGVAANDGF